MVVVINCNDGRVHIGMSGRKARCRRRCRKLRLIVKIAPKRCRIALGLAAGAARRRIHLSGYYPLFPGSWSEVPKLDGACRGRSLRFTL